MTQNIKEIKPNPLVSSTVEIRFQSQLKSDEILPKFIQLFSSEFPKFKQNNIPEVLRKKPEFEFQADHILSNNDFSIAFSNKSISFENVGEYKLWPTYFSQIRKSLEKLESQSIVSSIQRVGVRYISIFETKEPLEKSLNLKFNIGYPGFSETAEYYRTVLKRGEVSLILQVANNAIATIANTKPKTGMLLDIDAFQDTNLPSGLSIDINSIIDKLHDAEKSLFQHIFSEASFKNYEISK